jgi:formylglycine-generating enzyme required for sulfatase activity
MSGGNRLRAGFPVFCGPLGKQGKWAMISVRGVASAAVVAAVLLVAGAVQAAITIETVPVGDPENAPDMRYAAPGSPYYGNGVGYGSVAYTYNIGKYEVTAGQYMAFLNAVAKTDTYGLYNTSMDTAVSQYGCNIKRTGSTGNYTYTVASDYANRPVNYVSFWDSCRFANWLTNGQPTGSQDAGTTERGAYTLDGYNIADGRTIQRSADAKWAVTSESEWYKAAYYKGGGTNAGYWDFPTSSDTAPGQDMADPLPGNNANYRTAPNVYPIDSGKYTTVAGEFENSESPYGTFDQGGNVWEWNESVRYPNNTAPYGYRGLRGASFEWDDFYLRAAHQISDYPSEDHTYDYGFRVVQVPEPATMGLLALGGLALAARRRGRK